MGVDTPHPAYVANIDAWTRCRNAYLGEDAIKAAGQDYLPRLAGQDAREYGAYLKRAMYFEAVGRTIDGFTGAIARKDPVVSLPDAIAEFVDDVTADGVGLAEFTKKLCGETLLTGRAGVLVDFDDAKARSFLTFYTAESITTWGDFGVVLREDVILSDPADRFKLVTVPQYRQLSIEDGRYAVTVWRKAKSAMPGEQQFVVFEQRFPTVRGLPIGDLPFFWLSTMGMTQRIEKPPLLGLVNIALSHYRTSADLEHGRHFTGLPTLWVTGDAGEEPLHIGSASVMRFGSPEVKIGYAEFSGQGLSSLEHALEEKAHMMAVLGASLVSAPKKGVEAAETARIRISGEQSLLMGVVSAVEETLEAALECATRWMGAAGAVEITINRDFAESPMDGPMLTALVQAYQAGAITLETFLFNLTQSEMADPNTTIDEHVAALTAAGAPKPGDAARMEAEISKAKAKAPAKVAGAN